MCFFLLIHIAYSFGFKKIHLTVLIMGTFTYDGNNSPQAMYRLNSYHIYVWELANLDYIVQIRLKIHGTYQPTSVVCNWTDSGFQGSYYQEYLTLGADYMILIKMSDF